MDAAHERRRHVGEILVDEGIIGADDLARALAEQSRSPRPLGRVIVELGLASPGAIANALAEQHGGLLKTEYGVSTGLTRVAEVAEPAAETQTAPTEVAPDVLAAWRQAVGERDEMIRKLAATLKQRDADLADLRAQPAPEPQAGGDSPETLERLRLLAEQLETARAEANAAAEARETELELLTAEVRARDAELARVRGELEAAASAGGAVHELEQRLAAAQAERETELSAAEARAEREAERLTAQVRSRDAELAVLQLQAERLAEAEAATAAQEPEPEREHLLFLLRDGAYRIERREGPPPAPGDSVDGDLVVVRVGPSPLPDGPRTCAYLAAR